MADGGHFDNNSNQKSLWTRYLMSCWLDRIQIWCGVYLCISDDLVNFWEESLKNKMADEGYLEVT